MVTDPTEPRTKTVRIPEGTASITLSPAFGGGYLISFMHPTKGFTGDSVTAPAGVTFNPDGTLTYSLPFDPFDL